MFNLINDMLNYFGLNLVPATFAEFIVWFVAVLIGVEFVLFIFDSIFYTIRQINKGGR